MPPLERLHDQENVRVGGNQSPRRNDDEEVISCNGSGRDQSLGDIPEGNLKQHETPTRNSRGVSVSFSGQNRLHIIPGREDFSQKEVVDSWYKAHDYAIFRKESFLTADISRIDPSRIDDIEYTLRGAEHRVREVFERRNSLRLRARRAVLLEQEFQEGIGEPSADRLAEEYAQVTADAVYDALHIAALDQIQATRFTNESSAEESFSDQWISSLSSHVQNPDFLEKGSCAKEEGSLEIRASFDETWLDDEAEVVDTALRTSYESERPSDALFTPSEEGPAMVTN